MTLAEELTGAVDRLGAAFLAGDAAAVLGHFAAEGPVVYAGSEPGDVAVGREAVHALLEELLARDERYSWRTTTCHVTGSDAPGGSGYVVAEVVLGVHPVLDGAERRPGPVAEELPYRLSGVLEKGTAGWRWRLCEGSEPAGS